MKKSFRTFLTLCLLVMGTAMSWADDGVLVTWDFTNSNCAAGQAGFQGNTGTVASDVEGIALYVDATNGKFNSAQRSSDIQINATTIIQIPVKAKGDVITITNYGGDYGIGYTIGAEEIAKTVDSYTYSANKAEATQGYVEMTVTTSGYARKITVLQHEPQPEGGKTYTDEAVSVTWAMNNTADPYAAVKSPEDAFSTIAFDYGAATITGTADISFRDNAKIGGTGIKFKPKVGASDVLTWTVKPAVGLTFTPTHIKGYINRCGTDAEKAVKVNVKMGDGTSVDLGAYTAWRSSKTANNKDYDADAVYFYDVTLTAAQQAALKGSDALVLTATIGVGNGKEGAFGEVVIEGTVSGTIANVNKYTVDVAAAPAEGGSVSLYPKSDDYVEGDEITLTAVENFGYDFVNWTNKSGEEVSKEAKFKTTATADETYTANFKKVETYELKVNIDGEANDYMISYNPAPTVIDNKNMYEAGTKVTLTASENPIITFNSWSTGETAKEIVVDMTSAQELTAEYSAVDFLVGWDFMKAGNNGRAADFYSAENDAVSLVLRNAEGNLFGWLDKSQLGAGGYEGRPGGVNWKNDVAIGTTYWQTEVNAEAFTNLKIKTAMVYNYNAYQKYNVQASLDGEAWETIGSIKMPGAKNWTDLEASFPEKYNNQKTVYVRWIADKSSNIDGTSSANDGACLGASYITGTKKLINDGVAPVLVKTVPAEGADNASANGKIVLTFDEKVKTAEGAKATIGTMQLTPVVSGKTVSFEYKGLEYSTSYTFTLPANTVADLTDNYLAEAVTVNFQTKQKPAIQKALFDVVVSNGDELAAAINAANTRADQNVRFRIFVKKGAHVLPTNGGKTTGGDGKEYDDPRTTMTASNVSIIGEDFEATSFTNITPGAIWDNGYGAACPLEGIGKGDVLINKGTNNYFQGITIRTSMGDAHGRDIAFNDQGNKTIFKDARLWGYQDTYVSNSNKSRYYFENGVIRGRTDYICGKGDVWYEKVTFQQVKSGYLAVPSNPTKYGYILNECTIVSDGTGSNDANGAYTLGRPWGSGTPIALYINCVFKAVPTAEGWSEMSGGWPARFAEYNSTTTKGTVIDLSKRKKTFGNEEKGIHENCNNPVLTAVEASEYSIAKVMGEGDDWDPTALTEQASAPKNVILNGLQMSWDDSNYALCYAIIKNGSVVDFTTEATYTIDDATATWAVRAANEMGGLGEATTATTPNGIQTQKSDAEAINGKFAKDGKIIIVKDGKTSLVSGIEM